MEIINIEKIEIPGHYLIIHRKTTYEEMVKYIEEFWNPIDNKWDEDKTARVLYDGKKFYSVGEIIEIFEVIEK